MLVGGFYYSGSREGFEKWYSGHIMKGQADRIYWQIKVGCKIKDGWLQGFWPVQVKRAAVN